MTGEDSKTKNNIYINMASTFGPIDGGILDEIIRSYYEYSGNRVRYTGAGTGKVIEMAKTGRYDLILVHEKSLEEDFVNGGYGTQRIDLMYNDFVIVGPRDDPAKIKSLNPFDAFTRIKNKGSLFISRGDFSGTHIKEMKIWEETGLKPSGEWYFAWGESSKGNAEILGYANRHQAYTIIDRSTYLILKNETELVVLVEKHETLLNYMTLIPINPKKYKHVKYDLVMDFIRYTISEEGQTIIQDFKFQEYGESLFLPNSSLWKNHE